MDSKMNPEIRAQWTAALRSGEYEQGRGYLNVDGKLCCLGVLCELAVKAGVIETHVYEGREAVYYDGSSDTLTVKVREWAGLPENNVHNNPGNPSVAVDGHAVSLAELNDGENDWKRHSFDEIADLIDAQL